MGELFLNYNLFRRGHCFIDPCFSSHHQVPIHRGMAQTEGAEERREMGTSQYRPNCPRSRSSSLNVNDGSGLTEQNLDVGKIIMQHFYFLCYFDFHFYDTEL